MSDDMRYIGGFGTLLVLKADPLGNSKFEVVYRVVSGDTQALGFVAKAARGLDSCTFVCTNERTRTVEMHVVSNDPRLLLNPKHPFHEAFFTAVENLVTRTKRSLVTHRGATQI